MRYFNTNFIYIQLIIDSDISLREIKQLKGHFLTYMLYALHKTERIHISAPLLQYIHT